MSRKSKRKREPRTPKPSRPWPHKARAAKLAALLFVIAAGAVGLMLLRGYLLGSAAYAEKLARVVLAETPDDLPRDIPAGVLAEIQAAIEGRSVFEASLARDVYAVAAANPWVEEVQRVAKRHDGAVVVQLRFRRPFALAVTESSPGERHVIDAAGVLLPLRADRVRPGAFIAIDGVLTRPPRPGQPWNAPDLADGLRLCRLLRGRPYESQITTIDVRNHNGRIDVNEPHLRMYAQVGQGRRTAVVFGRFPLPDGLDYCVPPEDKFARLDDYVAKQGGRLAGVKDWIDLRYDEIQASIH